MDFPIKVLISAVAVPVFGAFLIPLSAKISTTARNALAHFKRALELHDRVGVKKEIERLERLLKA